VWSAVVEDLVDRLIPDGGKGLLQLRTFHMLIRHVCFQLDLTGRLNDRFVPKADLARQIRFGGKS
jgi:hypothetical protein